MRVGERIVGVLSAQRYVERGYGDGDVALLEALASHAAAAMSPIPAVKPAPIAASSQANPLLGEDARVVTRPTEPGPPATPRNEEPDPMRASSSRGIGGGICAT
jgi:hypothetical protein